MATPDLEELRLEIVRRLPHRARWLLGGTPWDWDLSRAREALRPLSASEAEAWEKVLPDDWRELFIFGEEEFAAGGGASPFVAVHRGTGEVHGLDVERDQAAAFSLNSSVRRFIETFLLFDDVLGKKVAGPSGLVHRLRQADPEGFERSEWKQAAEYMETLPA